MNNYVITFARGFGSGGQEIATRLADDLGIECYEKRILTLAAEYSGYDEKNFVAVDERLRGHRLKFLPKNLTPQPTMKQFSSDEELFNIQAKIIRELAETESCVIVGRCADYILRNYPNVMSVFVHAPHEFCLRQAMLRNSMTEREMEKFIAKTDKYRGEYYRYYTGWEWSDARHYDLCLNSSKLGFEKCKDEILSYRKIRFGAE